MSQFLSKKDFDQQGRAFLIKKADAILTQFRHSNIQWDPLIPSDYLINKGATKLQGHFFMCKDELCRKKFRIVQYRFDAATNKIITPSYTHPKDVKILYKYRWALIQGKTHAYHIPRIWLDTPDIEYLSTDDRRAFLCGSRLALL